MTTSHVRRPRNGDPTAILPIEKSTGPGPESLLLGALAASREAAKPRRTRVHPVRSRGVMQPFMRVMYTTRPRPWSLGVRTGALYDGDLSSGQPGLRRFGSYLPGSKDVHVVELESKRCPWPNPNAITRNQNQILQRVPQLNPRLIPYHHPILNHSLGLNHAYHPDAKSQHILRPKGPNKVQKRNLRYWNRVGLLKTTFPYNFN